jgi:DNA-binding LacI/PurR family transcriptional regulator
VLSQLLSERVPVVMVSSWTDYVDCVAVDDHAGIGLLVDHLAGLGHTRIGYVVDPRMEPTTGRARVDAFERALLRHGLEVRPEWRVTWRAHDGGDGVARALLTAAERPTAIIGANDDTAIEVMELAESLGLAVPADLSLTGFDDVPVAGLSRIALTTVAQSAEALAERGLEFLLERIARGYDEPIRHARLEPALVVRGSTGPPA